LDFFHDVRVNLHGEGYLRVAEKLRDVLDADALGEQERRAGVVVRKNKNRR
jgi:hypothetical protein